MPGAAANRRALFLSQRGVCTGCRRAFPYRNFTVDHILPRSRGGGDGIGNLQLLCGACNSKKGAGTQEQLLAGLLAEGVIRASASLIGRRRKYAPAGEGTTIPVAAGPLIAIALPYVAAGAIRTAKIAWEHREEIGREAKKQARRVRGARVPGPGLRGLPAPRFGTRYGKWNAANAERTAVHRWWWWTATGGGERRAD